MDLGIAGRKAIVCASSRGLGRACAEHLAAAGCEVVVSEAETYGGRLNQLLAELGRRRMTNVLVEGGGRLLGTLLDIGQIDEVHVFVAPKLLGGETARSPIDGDGIAQVAEALPIRSPQWQQVGGDLYLSGRLAARLPELTFP